MVQVYVDGTLIYDPNLKGSELLGLTATVSADKAGTAEIVMLADHPAYNSFISYRSVIEIYRHGELVFRGRALFPADDFYNIRTITCEGERCFLRDAVMPPYLYQTSPAAIFTDVIGKYNAQVDEFKQFKVGLVSAHSLDSNNYQYIECETASLVSDVIDKLIEYVGGYITFTTDTDGKRVINWLSTLDTESGQAIEFGENLLDYSRSDANDSLATVIYPYGAADETTNVRVNIEAVNDGIPYVKDDEAVALRGWIAAPVFWDDVTQANNLKRKAEQYLKTSRMVITSLELSAVDLSAMDKSIDALRVGENIRVLSEPHGMNDTFLLHERQYDFLDPTRDRIILGKSLTTLTGSAAATEKTTTTLRQTANQTVTNTYNIYTSEGGESGGGSGTGENGATFYPNVDDDGTLSWSNDKGLANPDPVNIKGDDGESPTIEVSEIEGGHRIVITNADGTTQSFDVLDGEGSGTGGAVSSVNGMTGDVVLTAADVGATSATKLLGSGTFTVGDDEGIDFVDSPDNYTYVYGRVGYAGTAIAMPGGSNDARILLLTSFNVDNALKYVDIYSARLTGTIYSTNLLLSAAYRTRITIATSAVSVSELSSVQIGDLYGVR